MSKQKRLRQHPWLRVGITVLSLLSIVTGMALVGALPMPAGASMPMQDVLRNGSFEEGFHMVPGCGMVGKGWGCFTNGGAAGYGFYDDQWDEVVADGEHSQLIEVNTKGLVVADPDRYAGIYQTVKVDPHGKYKLHLRGLIRTTNHEGDPYRYVVEVGWTAGQGADWQQVSNWQDVGWYDYDDRLEPTNFNDYTAMITAPAEHMTLYVRVWKKWGVPFEELDVNLDAISMTGVKPMAMMGGEMMEKPMGGEMPMGEGAMGMRPMKPEMGQSMPMQDGPMMEKPVAAPMPASCGGKDLVYNGGFEHGFNPASVGHVGRGWGSFTNGGAAAYGFYDEMWEPVVSSGEHGQLIEINTKGIMPADGDRYAGIYQKIGHLEVGKTYELVVRGMLRGDGGEPGEDSHGHAFGDPHRFEAQVGYNWGYDANWQHVGNWTGMDLGEIYPRTEPGSIGTYRVRFKAEAPTMVLFLRGWLKWGETNLEFDLNLDDISIKGCMEQGKPMPMMPEPKPMPMGMQPEMKPGPEMGKGMSCTYVVKPGDSLSAIAVRYDVSMQALMQSSHVSDPNLIFIGQKLTIPGCDGGPGMEPDMEKQPQPEKKQAMAAPMKPEEPMREPAMGLRSSKPGMEAPMGQEPMWSGTMHKVRAGETLSGICAAYGTDPHTVARLNGLANANFIYVGQELMIP